MEPNEGMQWQPCLAFHCLRGFNGAATNLGSNRERGTRTLRARRRLRSPLRGVPMLAVGLRAALATLCMLALPHRAAPVALHAHCAPDDPGWDASALLAVRGPASVTRLTCPAPDGMHPASTRDCQLIASAHGIVAAECVSGQRVYEVCGRPPLRPWPP